MNETLKRIGVKDGIQLIDVCGLHAFERALNNLNPDKIDKTIFVEALACEGGCIGGPCISTNKASLSIVSDVLSKVKNREYIPKKATTIVDYDMKQCKFGTNVYPISY